MSILITKAAREGYARLAGFLDVLAGVAFAPSAAVAQDMLPIGPGQNQIELPRFPTYIIPGKSELSTLYFDGSEILIESEQDQGSIATVRLPVHCIE